MADTNLKRNGIILKVFYYTIKGGTTLCQVSGGIMCVPDTVNGKDVVVNAVTGTEVYVVKTKAD